MHHKRDWKKYNKQLINRGKINFWAHPKVLERWKGKNEGKACRPLVYSDELIKAISYIRFKFHLSLRETEGFFWSLVGLVQMVVKIPCYTQICRRMKCLKFPPELLAKRNVTDIVLDTTGLKVYGPGEWCTKKYGGKRKWKKLHLALDPKSGKLVLAELTNEYVHDTTYLEKALQRSNRTRGKVLIDGIADSRRCYCLTRRYNKTLLTPPKTGAVFRKEKELQGRNDAVRIIRGFGGDRMARSIWSKLVGYGRRSAVESMVSRWKRLLGSSLRSRCDRRKEIEVRLKAEMINQMIGAAA
jgi:Transposase DDE domain